MAKRKQKHETGMHEHEWFPVGVDENREFAFYECVGCTETLWRNVDVVYPIDAIE